MVVFGVYIVSKSGGLIFNLDHNTPKIDTEKVFNFPVDLKLEFEAKNITVVFGQRDGINGRRRPLCVIDIGQKRGHGVEIFPRKMGTACPRQHCPQVIDSPAFPPCFQLDMCWLH